MLNKLSAFIRKYDMITPGDHVVCAISGGADSVALLFGLYLLKEKFGFSLSAAHFNHHLRGAESDGDEAFVIALCDRYDIPLHLGGGEVKPGKKGLEAAARDARYAFLRSLPGKIATAHTADDNAETVLMHLVRGTGLKGLCGITPVGDALIRPMLAITRSEVEAFLEEYCLRHITDSSNETDAFLRNRLRHHVMPLLRQENPRLAENLSAMALQLQQEEQLISATVEQAYTTQISALRHAEPALRNRILERFLKKSGVKEPERTHIALAESLVFSDNPSARAQFPGVTIERCYDTIRVVSTENALPETLIPVPGVVELEGFRVTCRQAETIENTANTFTVNPQGKILLRSRCSGDEIRLCGGTKSLKKLFIDKKIPASDRNRIPVLADDTGVLGVYGIGADLQKISTQLPAVQIIIERMGEN